MNKYQEQIKYNIILRRLKPGEELIGFFQADYQPFLSWALYLLPLMYFMQLQDLWAFLLVPAVFLGARMYYVAVTNQGLHIHKLTFFSTPEVVNAYDFYSYTEISKIKFIKRLILSDSWEVVFSNGKKLTFKETLKTKYPVVVNKNVMGLDDRTRNFLLSKPS